MNLTATHKLILALCILAVLAAGVYFAKINPTVLEMAVAAFLGWLAPSPLNPGKPGA